MDSPKTKYKRSRNPKSFGGKAISYMYCIIKGVVTFMGVLLVWVGMFNLLDYYTVKQSLWMECIQLVLALLLLIATDVFGAHCKDRKQKHRTTFMKWVKSFIALFAIIVAWKSMWNLFDIYITKSTFQRELIYIVVGVFILIVTGAFHDAAESL
jgi:hypothetical protein